MRNKYENPKSEVANQLRYSSSTLQRFSNDTYIWFHHEDFNRITPTNERKRLQILTLTVIHIVNLTLKDLV